MSNTKKIFDLIKKEEQRQLSGIELIASENFTSPDVMSACGSVLTNKYAEGYPGKGIMEDVKLLMRLKTLQLKKQKYCLELSMLMFSPTQEAKPMQPFFMLFCNQVINY